MQLQILQGKNQTIASVLHETFPVLKCFNNEKLALISPQTVAYVHALIIDSISINSRKPSTHWHLNTRVCCWMTKMEIDSSSRSCKPS